MITPQDFIHPEDDSARLQLEAIPGFQTVVKAFLKIGLEQQLHGISMASKIRLGPEQLPELYAKLPPVCKKLKIPEPEFYLEMSSMPNAYTSGDSRVFLTVTSRLVEDLDDAELNAVIAHECGHIVCRHVLYHTMANLLLMGGASFLGVVDSLLTPVKLALCYWHRLSEFSADRAAAAVFGDANPVVTTMIRLSGGPKTLTGKVNIDAYIAQAEAYDKLLESGWDKLLQGLVVLNADHPFPAVRAREIRKWAASEEFERLSRIVRRGGEAFACPKCKVSCEAAWKFCESCGEKFD